MNEMDTIALQERLAVKKPTVLIDVRTPEEWAEGHIAEAQLIPLHLIPLRFQEIPKGQPVHLICRSGNRSYQAARWLEQQGYDVVNVVGGMSEWAGPVKY